MLNVPSLPFTLLRLSTGFGIIISKCIGSHFITLNGGEFWEGGWGEVKFCQLSFETARRQIKRFFLTACCQQIF